MVSSISQAAAVSDVADVMDWTPLYMSTIAGLSTCLGAVFVFFRDNENLDKTKPIISPAAMSFSLALAGSVMITVSVVSILPECLRAERTATTTGYEMIPILSMDFLTRLVCLCLGSFVYWILAKFAFPEPDEIVTKIVNVDTSTKNEEMVLQDDEKGQKQQSTISSQEDEHVRLLKSTANGSSVDGHDNYNDGSVDHSSRKNGTGTPNTRQRRSDTLPRQSFSNHDSKNSGKAQVNDNDDDNMSKKPVWVRSLSRYSSGADLESSESRRAWRVAMLLFLSLLVHNFPEGLAVAASSMQSPQLGLKVTIGIMIHNIPEGIAIAVPCIAARPDSPWLAFWLAAVSGLAEPFGAFVAIFVLRSFDEGEAEVLAFVAGLMVMVAVAELFPEACRHLKDGKTCLIAGTVTGIVIMVATDLYLI